MKKRNMKLLAAPAIAATSVLTTAAYAAYPTIEEPVAVDHSGFYVGGNIGWGQQNLESGHAVEPTTYDDAMAITNPATAGNITRVKGRDEDGLAGRIFIGYNFNQFFAVELGGAAWSQADYKGNVYDPTGTTVLGVAKGDQNAYDVDLLAKVTYPFENGFKVYAKGGGAYVWGNSDFSKTTMATNAPITRRKADDSESSLRPEAAVGVGYNIDDNWSVNVEYSYIWGNNDNALRGSNIPDLQQATIGVQYDIT